LVVFRRLNIDGFFVFYNYNNQYNLYRKMFGKDNKTNNENKRGLGEMFCTEETINHEEGVIDACGNMYAHAKIMSKNETPYIIEKGVLIIPKGETLVKNLNRLVIKEGVERIANEAFYSYKKLKTVVFPKSLLSIGKLSFGCSGLRSVVIPDGVISVEDAAFSMCDELKLLTCSGSLHKIGNGAFERCWRLGSVKLSDHLTTIGSQSFYGCRRLRTLQLPDSLESIGDRAFAGCGFRKIVIPKSIITIGDNAFNCSSLVEATVPISITNVGYDVFPTRTKIIRI